MLLSTSNAVFKLVRAAIVSSLISCYSPVGVRWKILVPLLEGSVYYRTILSNVDARVSYVARLVGRFPPLFTKMYLKMLSSVSFQAFRNTTPVADCGYSIHIPATRTMGSTIYSTQLSRVLC